MFAEKSGSFCGKIRQFCEKSQQGYLFLLDSITMYLRSCYGPSFGGDINGPAVHYDLENISRPGPFFTNALSDRSAVTV